MRLLFLISTTLLSSASYAVTIECTAQVFETKSDGSVRHEKKSLLVETENSVHFSLSADLDGRAFTLSGNKDQGPYFVSITQEPDYTKGSLTTAEFSSEGRLQLSTVDQQLVHKLECYKSPFTKK